jgi:hypothetical protein
VTLLTCVAELGSMALKRMQFEKSYKEGFGEVLHKWT